METKKNGLEMMQEIINEHNNALIFMGELKVTDKAVDTLYTPAGTKRHTYLVYEGPTDETGEYIMVNGHKVKKQSLAVCIEDTPEATHDNLEEVNKCWKFISHDESKDNAEEIFLTEEEKKIQMFEEIERIDTLMHAAINIKNSDLAKIFHDHMCVCGSLIFHTFLPDDIREEYIKWENSKDKK